MSVAFVFPGQGSQYVGMGRELAATWPVAADVFAEADEALGEPISRLAWEGEPAELDRTINAQPALLATSIAYLRALESAWEESGATPWRPRAYAGHSMGQYSALVAAGALSLADAIRLVRERGRLMQASAEDGAMAAVIGLDEKRLADLRAAGEGAGPFAIANRNAPGQVVVSGTRAAVEMATGAARELGAKRVIPLPVSVAAHSPLMSRAAEGMREALATVEFRDPTAPLLANADARPLTSGEACRAELIEHLTRGVDWVAAIERLADQGVATFVEVGPGKVLSGLIRRIAPNATALALDEADAPGRLRLPAPVAEAAAAR
ncbi:MAG TPA: ACP S-malonyltransferase [Candidatus Limnocylindrales bacterium]|nr:ACP S-malonyltransferase [Candidatus Limnocylindrales bacterium]